MMQRIDIVHHTIEWQFSFSDQISQLRIMRELNTDSLWQFCLVSAQFSICNCSVSNILKTTENLEIENWVETRQNCLVLSPIVFTPPTRTRQDTTVFVLSVSAVWTIIRMREQILVRGSSGTASVRLCICVRVHCYKTRSFVVFSRKPGGFAKWRSPRA